MEEPDIEDELAVLEQSHVSLRARLHGEEAVEIARYAGLFDASSPAPHLPPSPQNLREASGGDHLALLNWKQALTMQSIPTPTPSPLAHSPLGNLTVTLSTANVLLTPSLGLNSNAGARFFGINGVDTTTFANERTRNC